MHIRMMILNEQVNVKFCVSLEYEIQVYYIVHSLQFWAYRGVE